MSPQGTHISDNWRGEGGRVSFGHMLLLLLCFFLLRNYTGNLPKNSLQEILKCLTPVFC